MEKKLAQYLDFLAKNKVSLEHHAQRVREFQHERLVHLLITLFFAGLMIGAVVWRFMIGDIFDDSVYGIIANIASGVLCLILAGVEFAYVRHYYQLENGVQKLYEYTQKMLAK
jgi:uncharacterized membrane protein